MKYTGNPVGRSEYAGHYVRNRIYDDRQIMSIASRYGLRVCRPNGSPRYRGSRKLNVVDPAENKTVWHFTAYEDDAPTRIAPVVVGRF